TVASGTAYVATATTFTGTVGKLTYNTNSDGSASNETITWYPGPYYGMRNITPDTGQQYGSTTTSVPAPTPISGAAASSSGTLGSVGWRSMDGSWTGAPVWQVGTGFVALNSGTAIST